MDLAHVLQAPVITSVILAVNVVFLVLVTIDVVHPLQLAYSSTLIFEQKQHWRLFSNFFFIGKIGVDSFFTLMWLHTTSREIEEEYFMGRPLDYLLTILTGMGMLLGLRFLGVVEEPFMSVMFSNVLMYLFSRLGPNNFVDILAIFQIRVRLLPVAFAVLTIAFNGLSKTKPLLFSHLVGHILWFFVDVFPRITGLSPFKVQRRLEQLLFPLREAPAPAAPVAQPDNGNEQ